MHLSHHGVIIKSDHAINEFYEDANDDIESYISSTLI